MHTLKISLLHAEILHSRIRENRSLITSLAANAADAGARIVVAPEMCLSGYIFQDRMAIAPFVEAADGPSADAFAKLAREKSVYLVAGFAEIDPANGVYYNSAFAWGPDGSLLARYRKVNAESRWACPGPAVQQNAFDTPWGRFGLVICSDAYHSLPARTCALRGARMLLIPANWPPTESFPENVWRFRAKENGVWLAAANRTGDEADFSCRACKSYVIDPQGNVAAELQNPGSGLLTYEIPLTPSGEVDGTPREAAMKTRRPWLHHRLYANLAFFRDITEAFKLPKPGPTVLNLLSPGGQDPAAFLEAGRENIAPGSVSVLPLHAWTEEGIARLEAVARERGASVVTALEEHWDDDGYEGDPLEPERIYLTVTPDGTERWPLSDDRPAPQIHLGTLAVTPVRMRDLVHPETALSAAKQGTDLLLAAEDTLGPDDGLTVSMRPIDQAVCAVCARDGSAVGLVPQGHSPGVGSSSRDGEWLTLTVDSVPLRNKRFQDRIDFELLFAGTGNGPWE
ncbi:MAG: carbon-nitrogen hydrolase family protein [Deltaproteobacteria bacterium]|jgi:predicted amidohydrolase|nr:carbon-nitrogen hydrolase family protein [Deltaproteobacteria bacterium]